MTGSFASTASMVARLCPSGEMRFWFTPTPYPHLSAYKPFCFPSPHEAEAVGAVESMGQGTLSFARTPSQTPSLDPPPSMSRVTGTLLTFRMWLGLCGISLS